jgi:hypothetical protein
METTGAFVHRLAKCLVGILILVLGLVAAFSLVAPIVSLPARISKDYGEGWNAFLAVAAVTDSPLYPDPSALKANNYPPLSFFIIGGLGYILPDCIIVGRIISLISLFIVSVNIGACVRVLGAPLSIAMFAGLLFLSFFSVHFSGYVATNDPQLLAHAFVTCGLLAFLYGPKRVRSLFMSSLLMFAGGLVKHDVVPLPIAVTVWLFLHDRRRFYLWTSLGIALIALSMTIFWLSFGYNFFVDVFYQAREYHVERSLHHLRDWLGSFAIFLPTPFLVIWLSQDCRPHLISIYVLISAAWCIIIYGGAGIDVNALFDLLISLTMTAALSVHYLNRRFGASVPFVAPMAMASLILPVLIGFPHRMKSDLDRIRVLKQSQAIAESDIKYLSSISGPVMCESNAVCYWAGKEFEVDFFTLGQKLFTGTMDSARLVEAIDKKRFAVIQLGGEPEYRRGEPKTGRLPDRIVEEIRANYRVDRYSEVDGWFLRPSNNNAFR